MSDLFLGQTCTALIEFISAGTAHTFTFPWQADKAVFVNLTKWASTAGNLPISVWYRNHTTAAHAFQEKVIDSAAAQSFNFLDQATNGFTVADTSGGVPAFRANISGVTAANPVVVTTAADHNYQDNQIVRITNLGNAGAVNYGMDQLNNNRYKITVLSATTFSLQDPVTGEDINGTAYTAYISGGYVNLETRVITENNPQLDPVIYIPNQFKYDPIEYKLTAGTAVMGADGDQFVVELYKWGQIINLGDLVT